MLVIPAACARGSSRGAVRPPAPATAHDRGARTMTPRGSDDGA